MSMLTPRIYVPLLSTKRGELSALEDLDSQANSGIVPLFVVHAVDWDFDKDEPRKTLDEHVKKTLQTLLAKWRGSAAFVDTQNLSDEPLVDGRHPLQWIAEEMRDAEREGTPVTSLDRPAAYQRTVQGLVASGADLCIRLAPVDWAQATDSSSNLFSLIALVGATPARTHLVFDAGSSVSVTSAAFLEVTLKELEVPGDWASVSVAGSSMPASMPSGDGLHRVERSEWSQYKDLVAASLPRTPSFSDYGVQSPDARNDLNPRLVSPSNNLRYLVEDYWYIPKAGQFKKGGSAPLVSMLRLLTARPEYAIGYSACEIWIDQVIASPEGSSAGNAETWRRYGTGRHITRSVELLSSLHGPSTSPAPGLATP